MNQTFLDGQPVQSKRPRRAMIIAGSAASASLQQQLASSGYDTATATPANAIRATGQFSPDVVIIELATSIASGEADALALARRMRSEPGTSSLPIVLVWNRNDTQVRNAALALGVDDYLPVTVPVTEMLARLDSLFWRTESGRRASSAARDRRKEIDNLIFMLDTIREDIRAGLAGSIALLFAVPAPGRESLDQPGRERTLNDANEFLVRHLRRVDSVAFYGPTTLLLYLPRMDSPSAVEMLSRLHAAFVSEYAGEDVAIGLASFPQDGTDVELLIERAESAVGAAHAEVVAASARPPVPLPSPEDVVVEQTPAPPDIQRAAAEPKPVIADAAPLFEVIPAAVQAAAAELVHDTQPLPQAPEHAEPVTAVVPEAPAQIASEPAVPPSASAREPAAVPVAQPQAPRPHGDYAQLAAQAAEREREQRAAGVSMPKRLLLALSDTSRMAQINSLVRAAGYEARAAFDGAQTITLLRIERPDAVLIDYTLQGGGVETVRRLQRLMSGAPAMPVVMVVPAENETALKEAHALGGCAVTTYPLDPFEILAAVRSAAQLHTQGG